MSKKVEDRKFNKIQRLLDSGQEISESDRRFYDEYLERQETEKAALTGLTATISAAIIKALDNAADWAEKRFEYRGAWQRMRADPNGSKAAALLVTSVVRGRLNVFDGMDELALLALVGGDAVGCTLHVMARRKQLKETENGETEAVES